MDGSNSTEASGETKGGSEANGTVPSADSNEALLGNGMVSQRRSAHLKDMIKCGQGEVSSSEETVSLLGSATAECSPSQLVPSGPATTSNTSSTSDPPTKPCDSPASPDERFLTSPPPSANHRQTAAIVDDISPDSPTKLPDPKDGPQPLKSILINAGQVAPEPKGPPDGGWGWVVVFASFMMNLISDGVSLSFGILFVELVEFFGESKSKTSWVGSLFLSIPLLTGPIASALTDHFGCRKVAIAGSVLAALGFFLGRFSSQIEHLFFAFSLSGFGISLLQVTSIVSVAYYFEKRRSLATGLSVCGTGIGTFIFAPLTRYLLKEYKWQGTMLILGGIFLNIICFAMLIRDLDLDFDSDSSEEEDSSEASTSDVDSNVIDSELGSIAEEDENEEDEHLQAAKHNGAADSHKDGSNESLASRRITFNRATRMRHISECEPMVETMPRTCSSLINIPTYIKNSTADNQQTASGDVVDESIGELTFRRGGYLHNLITYYPHLLSLFLPWNLECNDLTVKTVPAKSGENQFTLGRSEGPNEVEVANTSGTDDDAKRAHQVDFTTPPQQSPTSARSSPNELSGQHGLDSLAIPVPTPPNYPEFNFRRMGGTRALVGRRGHRHRLHQHPPKDDLFGNYLHNLRLQRGSLTYRSAMLIISKYKLKASSAPDIYKTSMATLNDNDTGYPFFRNLKSIITDMFDLSLFKNIPYAIFCFSNFLLYCCVDIPYIYLPDQAITSGSFDKEGSARLISIIGFVNTLGVVFIGYIGDKPWLDSSMIYAFFIAMSGFSLSAIPLTNNTFLVSACTAIYGFAISANYSLVSVILVELITLDSFTQAYGLLLLVQGIGSLVGPPIVGWLFDTMGTYSVAFYLTGICVFISALFVIPVGDRRNCFLWSYRISRTGSSTSLAFKPLSFMKEGVYGTTVCSKRNTNPRARLFQLNNQQKALATQTTVPFTDGSSSPPPDRVNGHHVVIIDEEEGTGAADGGGSGSSDEDNEHCPAAADMAV